MLLTILLHWMFHGGEYMLDCFDIWELYFEKNTLFSSIISNNSLKVTAAVTTFIDYLYPLVINHTNALRFLSKFIAETEIEYLRINGAVF